MIYKILLPAEWAGCEGAEAFAGSPLDLGDGFVHLSTAAQVHRTATRFFAGVPALVVLSVDPEALGDALKWETNEHGTFPHLYAPLPMAAVTKVRHVTDAADLTALPD
ncbi:DUF952 domain-containing protein [Dactylosporangium sp. NPDC049140]|uniref:DUF952 domain-containing protein n=1 Tax=Dactylosporangium sp. NPDC049140 TaxID=3155647 RepID=UPI0033D401CB